MKSKTPTVFQTMQEISEMGYCVVLKCLPPGFPWMDFNEASRLEIANQHKWCAEAQFVKLDGFRPRRSAFGTSPEAAMKSILEAIRADDERYDSQKCWCDNCNRDVTFSVNGIGMWICDLCSMDITPNKLPPPPQTKE